MSRTLISAPLFPGSVHQIQFSRRLIALIATSLALITLAAWWSSTTSVTNLSSEEYLIKSKLHERWEQGNVVVMVRHAERCDRSSNVCMGSPDGITINGRNASLSVGAGLRKLGLDNTAMIASPLTRTRQTADIILGKTVITQDWVGQCDGSFKGAVLDHKSPGENLVIITHSGCIDQFERKMGVLSWNRSSEYTEAVFVQVDGTHKPKILGALTASQWEHLASGHWD